MRRNKVLAASAALACGAGVLVAASSAGAAPRSWGNVPSRGLAYAGSLDRVDVVNKTTAWAVGSTGQLPSRKPVILRWNGAGWARQASPINFSPTDVAGAGPRKAWAIGYSGLSPVAVHWNGNRWRSVAFPVRWQIPTQLAASPDGTAYAVTGLDISAGGPSTVLRWNGRGFVKVNNVPAGVSVVSVDVRAKNDVWLAGTSSATGLGVTGLVLHWNGRQWRRFVTPGNMGTPGNQAVLQRIVAGSANNVYVLRASQRAQTTNALLHWNGTRWSTAITPLNRAAVGLSLDGAGGAWVLPIGNGARSFYWRWNGHRWSSLQGPARRGAANVQDADRIPGSTKMFSVGTDSQRGKLVPFLERYA